MTTFKLLFAFTLITIVVSGCGKDDPCENVQCLNGQCVDGSCKCDEGWTGSDCSVSTDPCIGVVCINGNCVNGICNCDKGYSGPDCSEEVTPSKIIANNITHIFSPEFDTDENGQSVFWDIIGGNKADIYVKIYLTSNPDNFKTSSVLVDQQHDERASFEFSYTFENPEESYSIEFWDDETFDDYMTGGTFIPYKPNSNFPEIINLGSVGDPLQIELDLSYEF